MPYNWMSLTGPLDLLYEASDEVLEKQDKIEALIVSFHTWKYMIITLFCKYKMEMRVWRIVSLQSIHYYMLDGRVG